MPSGNDQNRRERRVCDTTTCLYNKTKAICVEAGMENSYSNHCLRATAVTALDDAGYEARDIMTVSGHRSESSIRSYSRTSEDNKKKMSATLSSLTQNQSPEEGVVTIPVFPQQEPDYNAATNVVTLPPVIMPQPPQPQQDPRWPPFS